MPLQTAATAPTPTPTATVGVTVGGATLSSPQAVYQGFKAQRRELGRQLESLEGTRESLSSRLEEPVVAGADKKGIEQRISSLDERISAIDKQITEADAQVARAASVPGAAVDPPPEPRSGPPEEAWIVGTIFMFIVFLPLSIAYARRVWRRSAQIVTAIPKELSERVMRVEQTVEATAIEIERIGEGQRFMTRIFTEGNAAHMLPTASPQAAPVHGRPGDIRP
ncbi:MAG: hypothetical protein ABI556_02785 [Gemmatimonadales bacterium]